MPCLHDGITHPVRVLHVDGVRGIVDARVGAHALHVGREDLQRDVEAAGLQPRLDEAQVGRVLRRAVSAESCLVSVVHACMPPHRLPHGLHAVQEQGLSSTHMLYEAHGSKRGHGSQSARAQPAVVHLDDVVVVRDIARIHRLQEGDGLFHGLRSPGRWSQALAQGTGRSSSRSSCCRFCNCQRVMGEMWMQQPNRMTLEQARSKRPAIMCRGPWSSRSCFHIVHTHQRKLR